MPAITRSVGLSTPALAPADRGNNTFANNAADAAADIPAPVVTISATDLQAMQQRIADLEAAQQNPRRRGRSDSESDNGRAPKRSNLRGKSPDEYWGENHVKLNAFIRQCELNFVIDGCTRDKTRIAYAGFYCRGTPQIQWEEYKRQLEHREPQAITWDAMKKELRRQLGEGPVYFDKMYNKWQKATQRAGQTGREFGAYLLSIRAALQDLDASGAPNETQLIHRMRQGLRSELRAALYWNPTVPKDWPTFLEAVARAELSIQLENKSFSHQNKPAMHNKGKPVKKPIEGSHSHSSSHNSREGNTQGRSRGRGGRGGRRNYRGGKASYNGTSAHGTYSTNTSNLSHLSKDA